ncbi:hypothetical protein FD754_024243, partial [Muntiacus muntjak]
MLRAPALLLVFLVLVTRASSNMEETRMSITRATGSSAIIPCDLPTQSVKYIHWYKFQEGAVPRRLLYYDVYYSKVVLEPGISPGKYNAYEATDKTYKFVNSDLQESDSGVYHCAVWEKIDQSLTHFLLPILFTLNSEILSSSPIPQHLYSAPRIDLLREILRKENGKIGNHTVVQCLRVCLGMQSNCVLEQAHLRALKTLKDENENLDFLNLK